MSIEKQLESAFERQPMPPKLSADFQSEVMTRVAAEVERNQSRSSRVLKAYWLIAAFLVVAAISQVSWTVTVDSTLLWIVAGAVALTVGPVLLLCRLAGFSLLELVWRTIE